MKIFARSQFSNCPKLPDLRVGAGAGAGAGDTA